MLFFLFVAPKLILAQGDGHKEENHSASPLEEAAPLNDSIYSVNGDEDAEFPILKVPTSSPFPRVDILSGEALLANGDREHIESIKLFKGKTNPAQKHGQHEKHHVEEALHEWVSPDAKGHRIALCITIFSGLAFIGLSFFRIGEGCSKDPS